MNYFEEYADEVAGLLAAFLFSVILSVVYRITQRPGDDGQSFKQAMVLMAITIAASMMIIDNNLARAFGLVGAVSIIRFRTTVRSPRDMAFVFIAIALGMACGAKFLVVGGIFLIIICLVILGLWRLNFGHSIRRHEDFRLHLDWKGTDDGVKSVETFLAGKQIRYTLVSYDLRNSRQIVVYTIAGSEEISAPALCSEVHQLLHKSDERVQVSISRRQPTQFDETDIV